jgi:hypothetical protein
MCEALGSVSSIAKIIMAGCQWLTPIILATLESEIRRLEVPSQSR